MKNQKFGDLVTIERSWPAYVIMVAALALDAGKEIRQKHVLRVPLLPRLYVSRVGRLVVNLVNAVGSGKLDCISDTQSNSAMGLGRACGRLVLNSK